MSVLDRSGLGPTASSLVAIFLFACSDAATPEAPSGMPDSTSASGGADTTTATGGAVEVPFGSGGTTLVPKTDCGMCQTGTFCSVRLQCIPAGTCLDDADCAGGKVCDEYGICTTGGECGASEFDLTSVPPNLLLVLDRSCSMIQDRSDLSDVSATKWVPVVDALVQVTTGLNAEIQFGLEVFPDGLSEESECLQNPTGEIAVPVGPDGGAQIGALLQAARTDTTHPIYPGAPCQTNTWAALTQASQQAALADPERASYVVLITDGEPVCSDRSQPNEADDGLINQVIADLAARGVPTFVVGFGDVVDVDPEALGRYAVSGGTTPSADKPYYDAADGAQLLTALQDIAGAIVDCDFALGEAPPTDDLYVFFDDATQIAHDPSHVEGWDYDPASNTLAFYGQACQLLQNDQVTDIDVVYGCPAPKLE